MVYAQFYQNSIPHPFNGFQQYLIEGCGDRSIIILDGRNSDQLHHGIARDECIKRGFVAYRLFSGNSLLDSQPTTSIIRI